MDFQGIIHRLRPNSRYLLRDGGGALYTDILKWQDPETTQPTEQECLDEWDVMLAEWADARLEQEQLVAMESAARIGWKDLGDWIVTYTPNDAELYVRNQIFDGINQDGLDDWIDTNVTNIATAKIALKQMGANILTIRTFLGVVVKVILYIRDILIKKL